MNFSLETFTEILHLKCSLFNLMVLKTLNKVQEDMNIIVLMGFYHKQAWYNIQTDVFFKFYIDTYPNLLLKAWSYSWD